MCVKYEPRLSAGIAIAEAWFAPVKQYDLPFADEPDGRARIPVRRRTIRVKAVKTTK